jgi:hypothetical protein
MYIDPGSGVLAWQVLVSAFFGIIFHFRNSVRRFASKIMRPRKHGTREV